MLKHLLIYNIYDVKDISYFKSHLKKSLSKNPSPIKNVLSDIYFLLIVKYNYDNKFYLYNLFFLPLCCNNRI